MIKTCLFYFDKQNIIYYIKDEWWRLFFEPEPPRVNLVKFYEFNDFKNEIFRDEVSMGRHIDQLISDIEAMTEHISGLMSTFEIPDSFINNISEIGINTLTRTNIVNIIDMVNIIDTTNTTDITND